MKPKFMHLAKELSKNSTHSKFHLGSCVISKNRVVSVGFNINKTSPRSPHPWKALHAETKAILSADKFEDLKGCDLYVYRETKNGKPANSHPCKYCMELIKKAGIKRIYYSMDNSQGFSYTKV